MQRTRTNVNRKQMGFPVAVYFVFLWCDPGGKRLAPCAADTEARAGIQMHLARATTFKAQVLQKEDMLLRHCRHPTSSLRNSSGYVQFRAEANPGEEGAGAEGVTALPTRRRKGGLRCHHTPACLDVSESLRFWGEAEFRGWAGPWYPQSASLT